MPVSNLLLLEDIYLFVKSINKTKNINNITLIMHLCQNLTSLNVSPGTYSKAHGLLKVIDL